VFFVCEKVIVRKTVNAIKMRSKMSTVCQFLQKNIQGCSLHFVFIRNKFKSTSTSSIVHCSILVFVGSVLNEYTSVYESIKSTNDNVGRYR